VVPELHPLPGNSSRLGGSKATATPPPTHILPEQEEAEQPQPAAISVDTRQVQEQDSTMNT